jgi:hypothetical protein
MGTSGLVTDAVSGAAADAAAGAAAGAGTGATMGAGVDEQATQRKHAQERKAAETRSLMVEIMLLLDTPTYREDIGRGP